MQDGQDGPSDDLSFISTHDDGSSMSPTRIQSAFASPFSRRAVLRATAWGAALGATAALPRMGALVAADDPQLVYGPMDGKLVNAAMQVTQALASVNVADCVINATFRNPYKADGSPSPFWSYGFGIRLTASGGAYLNLRSDYQWEMVFFSDSAPGKRTYDDTRARGGTLPDLHIGGNATNDVQIIVSGTTAELLVNGVDVAAIDLGDLRNPGDVSIVTGIDRDSKVPGTTTDYLQFTVFSPAPPPTPFAARALMYSYGPSNGGLRHSVSPSNTVDVITVSGFRIRDGAMSARFFNPYDASVNDFDYGFEFRDTGTSLYRIILLSSQSYSLRYRSRASANASYGPSQVIQEGNVPNMKIGTGEANDMAVQINGAQGVLSVGGMPIANLDLTAGLAAGYTSIGTGFFADDEQMGAVTRYENFTVARLT